MLQYAHHVSFDKQGVINNEFVPEREIVNSAFYVAVIGLLKRISRVKPQFRAEDSCFLLPDNAPSYSALAVKTFLAKHGVEEIRHPTLLISHQRIFFSLSDGENCPQSKGVSGS
jgi:hypothetical protein